MMPAVKPSGASCGRGMVNGGADIKEVDDAWAAIAEKRLGQIEEEEVMPISWEDIKRGIKTSGLLPGDDGIGEDHA